jgi:hypothetical protein
LEDVPTLGLEKDRLLAAKAGATVTPSTKTTVTNRAITRLTQDQGRMVPLPSAFRMTRAEFQLVWLFFLPCIGFEEKDA